MIYLPFSLSVSEFKVLIEELYWLRLGESVLGVFLRLVSPKDQRIRPQIQMKTRTKIETPIRMAIKGEPLSSSCGGGSGNTISGQSIKVFNSSHYLINKNI